MLESDSQQALTLTIILAETALAVNKDNRANNVSVRSGVSRTILEAKVISWPGAKYARLQGSPDKAGYNNTYKRIILGN